MRPEQRHRTVHVSHVAVIMFNYVKLIACKLGSFRGVGCLFKVSANMCPACMRNSQDRYLKLKNE